MVLSSAPISAPRPQLIEHRLVYVQRCMHVLRHQWSEARRPFAKKYVDTVRDMMRDHREQSSSASSSHARRRQSKQQHGGDHNAKSDDEETAAVAAEWMSFALSGALPAGSPLLSFVAEYVQPQPLARARVAIDQVQYSMRSAYESEQCVAKSMANCGNNIFDFHQISDRIHYLRYFTASFQEFLFLSPLVFRATC